jgi:hypothetical protein
MQHAIITRFSMRVQQAYEDKAFRAFGSRENWFAYRARLMLQTLVPAILSQTVPPSQVLILMDRDDHSLWDRHLALAAPFHPIFTTGTLRDRMIADALSTAGHVGAVAQHRIDSDDLIAPDYIERTEEQVNRLRTRGLEEFYVVAAAGYISDLVSIQSLRYTASPFLCLFSDPLCAEGIYAFNHHDVVKRRHFINTQTRWLQLIHGNNIENKFRKVDPNFTTVACALDKMCLGQDVSTEMPMLSASATSSAEVHWPTGMIRPDQSAIHHAVATHSEAASISPRIYR